MPPKIAFSSPQRLVIRPNSVLVGSVFAMISYRYVAQKMLSTEKKEGRQTPPPF